MKNTKGKRFADNEKKETKQNSSYDNDIPTIKAGKTQTDKKKEKFNNIIYNIIIFLCLLVVGFAQFKIFRWIKDNNKNKAVLTEIQSSVHITSEEVVINNQPVVKANYDLSELVKKNSDTVGWINVPNTNINYPVVQGNDNSFYLDHSFNKASNSAGWIFADYNCKVKTSKNVIIYGHNRRDGSMFGSLKYVLNKDWISNADNNYINFADLNETGIYKIFSVFVCNDSDVSNYLQTNFDSKEALNKYMHKLKNISSYKFDTDIDNSEKMITLYTCHGLNNQRLIVCAAKVE